MSREVSKKAVRNAGETQHSGAVRAMDQTNQEPAPGNSVLLAMRSRSPATWHQVKLAAPGAVLVPSSCVAEAARPAQFLGGAEHVWKV